MSNNFNGSVLISLEDMKIQRAAMDHLSVVQALFKKDGDKKSAVEWIFQRSSTILSPALVKYACSTTGAAMPALSPSAVGGGA